MKTLQIFLLTFLLFSCSNSDKTTATFQLSPELIIKGELYGNGDENITEQNLVISNQTDWNLLQTKMNIVNPTFPQYPNMVDFTTYKVIAIFDKIRGNGGVNIGIASVTETQEEIQITISHSGPTEVATTVINQPFHIVKIPKTSKPIIFN
jgi:hypothetical protein